jgi:hypothetical protein
MIVAAFYTIGTPYEAEAAELVKTLDRFGLKHDVRAYEHPGSWVKAGFLIPRCIGEVHAAHPGEDVLYLDADARVTQDPTPYCDSLKGKADVGLFYLDNSPHHPGKDGRELCTGTLWSADTDSAAVLLMMWSMFCGSVCQGSNQTDQTVLQEILSVWSEEQQLLGSPRPPKLRIAALPPEMCWMDIISAMHYGEREPIIFHTQASRRHRRVVG